MVPSNVVISSSARFRVLAIALALLVSLAVSAGFSAPTYAQSGDLSASAEQYFGCGKRMVSSGTYFRAEHRVVAQTSLYNNCQLAGFHGAVIPLLSNGAGQVVGYGTARRYGVDGRGPCWPEVVSWWPYRMEWRCPPTVERHEWWTDSIDPSVADKATSLTLVHYPAPNDWLTSLQSLRAHLEQAVAIGKSVAEVVAIIGAL